MASEGNLKINEQKFYSALSDLFVGAKIEGQGGYVNLMKIKSHYYELVLQKFKDEVNNDPLLQDSFREEFFDKLYDFFKRYFNETGSVFFVKTSPYQKIYERIYSPDKDVALFWKTHMLYYVKSDILFKSIEVEISDEKLGIFKFYFDVGELKGKKNNEKRQLVFTFKQLKQDKDNNIPIVVLSVQYSKGGTKTKINNILKRIKQADKNLRINDEIVEEAIKVFKKQSEVDFFINKDAKKFLREQLDLYLHQLLLKEENKFSQKRLDQIKAVQKYALKIIDFISQFEDELVRIWNKPKFALNANYVITLDRLKPEIIKKIAKHPNLKEQIKEWQELGIVDKDFKFEQVFEDNLLGNTLSEKYKHLPIDTKYFKDLELEILAQFDNLDEALDGRLIKSENYQALITLLPKYREKVQTIYIDPPFNTGKDFDYIDKFQDSTWLSLMYDRLNAAYPLLKHNGTLFVHLDERASHFLKSLNYSFSFRREIIWKLGENPSFKKKAPNWIHNHDTILMFTKGEKYKFFQLFKISNNQPLFNWLDLLQKDGVFFIETYDSENEFKRVEIDTSSLKAKPKPLSDLWIDIYSAQYSIVQRSEILGFKTQKPEHLLRRIIQSSTEKGDLVLDFFAGIGTTPAVAHKLHRKWLAIEMGEHFWNYYREYQWIKKKYLKNYVVENILEQKENKVYAMIRKLGLLGRMKIILYGDQLFKWGRRRYSTLSRNINWPGGGFFKYYELEQYEDTLRKAKYKDYESGTLFDNSDNIFNRYIFFGDEKLAFEDVIKQDENGNIHLNFDNLYPNIDWPETLSNLLGLPIKRIKKGSVILQDGDKEKEIKFDFENMSNEEKIEFLRLIKPLIWWGE